MQTAVPGHTSPRENPFLCFPYPGTPDSPAVPPASPAPPWPSAPPACRPSPAPAHWRSHSLLCTPRQDALRESGEIEISKKG
ncbi:hypothetical protein D7X48_12210 [bacterium D16-50]|nr:hypothetical protein D7X48_12210 [bacterium D16-50]